MSKVIKIRRGLDIKLVGGAARELAEAKAAEIYAVCPDDFRGVTPKLLVKPDDEVKAGTPLFFDKDHPRILFTSPVSGTVEAIKRGEKRKITAITIKATPEQEYEQFPQGDISSLVREQVVERLLASGLWPMIIQRPYGRIANPEAMPKAIFVSGFDSAPLAPDMDFVLRGEAANLAAGFEVLRKLTSGKVWLGLREGSGKDCVQNGDAEAASQTSGARKVKSGITGNASAASNTGDTCLFNGVSGVERVFFRGPHPAGNVGVQINRIDPINKGDIVWTVDIQNVAVIGRLFNHGRVDMRRVVALTGSEVLHPKYVSAIAGAPLVNVVMAGELKKQGSHQSVRLIVGDVLSGKLSDADGYVDMYHNQITIIPDGAKSDFLGWIMPRPEKFSVSHSYFSWLMPKKRYDLDTNLNGGRRAFVVTGLFEKYFPMDIYPMQLIKACMAEDIDKMENLGIYEVLPEDFALCEFVDPSKTEIQQVIADGIDLMIKEVG